MNKLNILIIYGTRPEIIKLAPIIKQLRKQKITFTTLHTGQHYNRNMSEKFIQELELPQPKNLQIHEKTPGQQLGETIKKITEHIEQNPQITHIIIQGDTLSTLAGAISARYTNKKLLHIEAGIRSHDWNMIEEHNRKIIDQISDYLFSPTDIATQNLLNENINPNRIYQTGNTITETLRKITKQTNEILLITLHRAENVDNQKTLKSILEAIDYIAQQENKPVIWPMHPRTQKKIKQHKLEKYLDHIKILEPLPQIPFQKLMNNSKIIFTDSGGVQEEACLMQKPCITIRNNTERPETINLTANILSGTETDKIIKAWQIWTKRLQITTPNWKSPYGTNPSKKIIRILKEENQDEI